VDDLGEEVLSGCGPESSQGGGVVFRAQRDPESVKRTRPTNAASSAFSG
jgi:hypothetical protein